MALAKTPTFYKLVHQAIEAFGERHHITARQHFAPMLGYRGDNAAIMLSTALNYTTYNPVSPKPISIDQLYILLCELGEDRSVILNGLAKEFDLVVIPKRIAHAKSTDINALVDKANIENSDVFRVVKEAIEDDKISKEEKLSILKEIEEAQKANAELRDLVSHLTIKEEE